MVLPYLGYQGRENVPDRILVPAIHTGSKTSGDAGLGFLALLPA
jgi:hypothetical protein